MTLAARGSTKRESVSERKRKNERERGRGSAERESEKVASKTVIKCKRRRCLKSTLRGFKR